MKVKHSIKWLVTLPKMKVFCAVLCTHMPRFQTFLLLNIVVSIKCIEMNAGLDLIQCTEANFFVGLCFS